MQVSAYQFLDIVCECLADAGTASDPHSKLRRQWQPQALRLVVEGRGLGMGVFKVGYIRTKRESALLRFFSGLPPVRQ